MTAFRPLTPVEIEALPDEFYSDVDKLDLGFQYNRNMAGALIGAFDGEELVGVQGAVLQVHAGPLWVVKKHRGKSTAIRAGLWNKVSETVRSWGGQFVYMFARPDTPQVEHIIAAHRHRKVGVGYLLEV